jgi:DNA-binding NtrC family response regulator
MSPLAGADNLLLLVDDDEAVLTGTAAVLRANGFGEVVSCADSRDVMPLIDTRPVAAVLLDIRMPNLDGEDLLRQIRERSPDVAVIVLTGAHDIETAVRCMREGAFDYIVKTGEPERIVASLRKALEFRHLKSNYESLREQLLGSELAHPEAFASIITRDPRVRSVFLFVESVARTGETILITGETGTGKDLMARAVHVSSERGGAFVAVNAAGLDETMFADTLFGHRRGAFTGADSTRAGLIQQAEGGTLFLDEIGDLTPSSQIKLLRLLEHHEYYPLGSDIPSRTSARFVLATNRPLREIVKSGSFRKDLYYRLRTYEMRIPPLRERKGDLPFLLDHFLDEACASFGRKRPAFPPALHALLQTYAFPGNVRELRSMVHYAVSRQTAHMLSLSPFREAMGLGTARDDGDEPEKLLRFADRLPTVKQAVEQLIDEALDRAAGNQAIAAGLVGLTPQALSKRLQRRRGTQGADESGSGGGPGDAA